MIADMPGPLVADFRFGHEVAFRVRIRSGTASWWTQDGRVRQSTLIGRARREGRRRQRLLLPTAEWGPVVVRPADEHDRFYVWPGCTAWEFAQSPPVRHVVGWVEAT